MRKICGLLMMVLVSLPAFADKYTGPHLTINMPDITINQYPETPPPEATTLTMSGVITSRDLAAGVATAMAAGGHQFDFSTTDWQGSVVGSWQWSGDEEYAASFAVAKRWKEGFMPNTLMHLAYTPNDSNHWVMFGGTFRF